MKFNELPEDMRKIVLKLASEHSVTIEQATDFYLMGGDQADQLCLLADAGMPYEFIRMQNEVIWAKKNKPIYEEFNRLAR